MLAVKLRSHESSLDTSTTIGASIKDTFVTEDSNIS